MNKITIVTGAEPGREMRVKSAVLPLAVALVMTACAGRPQHYTEVSLGRITERSDHDGGPSGPRSQSVVVPAGNVIVHFSASSARSESPYFLYKIRMASGHMLQTQSTNPFNIGDCVQLWHAPLTERSVNDFNFVSGTLEKSVGCK